MQPIHVYITSQNTLSGTKTYVFHYLSLGRIDIRMPSNDEITTKFKLNPNSSLNTDITCNGAQSAIVCEDATSDHTFNFVVKVYELYTTIP